MEKVKSFFISLLGIIGAISVFGGGVFFAIFFMFLFVLSVGLEIVTNHTKKTPQRI